MIAAHFSTWFLCLLVLAASAARGAPQREPAVKPADLLDAAVFPQASCGMSVESAKDGETATIITTGAEFILDKAKDTIECRQRLAKQRPVARIQLPGGTLAGSSLSHQSAGAAIVSGSGGIVRVNGDSLLMVQPRSAGQIRAELLFTPDYHAQVSGNFNFFDPFGGVSFYEHGQVGRADFRAATDPVTIAWQWKADDVLWAGVSPPKPYDWDASFAQRIMHFGSSEPKYMYPSDWTIEMFRHHAGVLYLHNEEMWEHWQLNLWPKNEAEYRRVVQALHDRGMKLVVYASPMYFLKGTSIEHRADPDPHKGPGWHEGSNEPLYLQQAERIIKELGTDGLYFDGIYPSTRTLATSYHLSRAARDLVGEQGLLYYHNTTDALGDGHDGAYCPTLHGYYNMILKGEGEVMRFDPGYARYILCPYNISNAISYQDLGSGVERISPEQIDTYLRYNVRFMLMSYWFFNGEIEPLRRHYLPRLTCRLKSEIEPGLLRPTGIFEQFRKSVEQATHSTRSR